jgi:putative membrane protein
MHALQPLAIVIALLSTPVLAQTSGGTSGAQSSTGTSAGGQSSGAKSGSSGQSASGQISSGDSRMLADLVEANMAEIQTGKLALEKSQNPQVKTFAQMMIDDHTAALTQLQSLAQRKGAKIPDDTDLQHKALAKTLGAMSGETFDTQYLKRVGVNDHQRTVQLLQKVQKQAQDPDMKSMAAQMLPKVQHHLQMAQQTAASAMGNKGGDKGSQSGQKSKSQ